MPHSRSLTVVLSICLVSSVTLLACVADGLSSDCPSADDHLDSEGKLDFASFRAAAEEAGCMTPIGGHPGGSSP